jgi:hypothetical protein
MRLNDTDLLDLYKTSIDEMRQLGDAYERRLTWFTSLVSALGAATVAGVMQAREWPEFLAVLIGPLLLVCISRLARQGLSRFYQAFLAAVSARAKLEQRLGLTHEPPTSSDAHADDYWRNEPIVALRYIKSRKDYESSDRWIDVRMQDGDQKWTRRLFLTTEAVGWILGIAIALIIAGHFWPQIALTDV